MKKLLIIFAVLVNFTLYGQEYNFPKEINLVFDYILNEDYPEQFGDKSYQFRPIDWQIVDIDNDGITEVFLQTFPHYRQSPTITIFQIDKNDKVSRIIEGLAPGHLIELSEKDDYLDPHTTGTAIDLQLKSKEPEKYRKFAESSLKFGLSTVLYKNFIHTDKRNGKEIYMDLMCLDDYKNEGSCEKFQFSRPEQIIAGKLPNSEFGYFIAKVNNELFCYKILGFEKSTYIKKEIKIIELPEDFKKLQLDNGFIKYENSKGELRDLTI